MKQTIWFGLVLGGMLGGAVLAATPSVASADEPAACGSKENPCPLQKWMRANMGAQLAANDTAGLAKAFDKIASSSPDPAWTWAAIAKAGGEAAKKGDVAGAKAACKDCHDKYKADYKAKFRAKPAP